MILASGYADLPADGARVTAGRLPKPFRQNELAAMLAAVTAPGAAGGQEGR